MTETATTERVRILIADGAEIVRRGIRDVIGHNRSFTVVGESAQPDTIPELCLEHAPDIVFLGMSWSDDAAVDKAPGLAALRRTLRLDPFARVVVLVDDDAVDDLLDAIRSGARGVLLRDAPANILLQAARDIVAGGCALDPRLARRLFESLASSGDAAIAGVWPNLDVRVLRSLSPREQEVLRLLAQGCRNKEIARELGVSIGTVKTHLRHIFRKLKVYDRTTAVLTVLQSRHLEAA
jgi:two-component system nitrate/nitrite response regulator NarL